MANGKAVVSAGCSIVAELLRVNITTPEPLRATQVQGSSVEVMEGGLFPGELSLELLGKLQPMILVRLSLSTNTIMSTA